MVYGIIAEFNTPEGLLRAARESYQTGYRKLDAYTPFPVEGVSEAIGFSHTHTPLIVLLGGLIGCAGGFLLQVWAMVWSYPLNVGGRPLLSWPAFIPVTFEMTILCAALAAVFGMLAANGLPMPYHPVFNVPQFATASRTQFFLVIEAKDAKFDRQATREFLKGLGPKDVFDVEP
jgi:hypothetical protein